MTVGRWKWWREGITKSKKGVLACQILVWFRLLGMSNYLLLHATKEVK